MRKLLVVFSLLFLFTITAAPVHAEPHEACNALTITNPPVALVGQDIRWFVVRATPPPDGCDFDFQIFIDERNTTWLSFANGLYVGDQPASEVCTHSAFYVHCRAFIVRPTTMGVTLRGHQQATIPLRLYSDPSRTDRVWGVAVWDYRIVLTPWVGTGPRISATQCESEDC